MKKMTTAFSILLAVALALAPWAATIADARGGGGSGGGGGAPSGGAPSGGAPSGGAPSGGAPAGDTGDATGQSTASTSGSPSSSPGIGNPTTSPWGMPAASPRLTYGEPQTVTGEVTSIDPTTGVFSLRTAERGTLRLQTSPATLTNVRVGDQMTVQIR